MKNQLRNNQLTDEQVDIILKSCTADIDPISKKYSQEEIDEMFDQRRKDAIKARIDLQIERQRFEEEKRAFEERRTRGRWMKVVVGVCAMMAIVVLLPMTSQSAKGWFHNMSLEIFPEKDEVMMFPEDAKKRTTNEDEAWEYIENAIQAKRMLFPHMGDEWLMKEAFYDGPLRLRMYYGLRNEEVTIVVNKRNGADHDAVGISGGECIEEVKFVGDKDSRVRMYAFLTEEGIPMCGAEILYKNALYMIQSDIEYSEFQHLIRGIVFEE